METPASLNLETGDGFIKVTGAETNTITVDFIVFQGDRFLEISRSELEEKVDLTLTKNSEGVSIRIKQPGNFGWGSWKDRYYVSFVVTAPLETACMLTSSDGDISIRNLMGDQRCATSDGDVYAEDIDGELKVATSDGDINGERIQGPSEFVTSDGDIHVHGLRGNTRLSTSDGDIRISDTEGDATLVTSDGSIVLEQVTGYSSATTSDGSILFTDLAGALKASTSDGDIEGNFLKITSRADLSTSDGDINVVLPAGTGIDLKAEGEDVRVDMENFSGTAEEDYVKGSLNGGGIPVELSSSDGDVIVRFN